MKKWMMEVSYLTLRYLIVGASGGIGGIITLSAYYLVTKHNPKNLPIPVLLVAVVLGLFISRYLLSWSKRTTRSNGN